MITLYVFGPHFGLPDASPFVMKAELLLKLAGLSYELDRRGYSRAPKGKLPYLTDDGETVADSTFIRLHIERKYGYDYDRDLSVAQRGAAWAIERMCEEHLYWGLVQARWLDDRNFRNGPAVFFRDAPAPLRPLIKAFVRRGLRRTLRAQGLGRHTAGEVTELMRRDLAAIADVLGEQDYLFGAEPRGVDATAASFVTGCLCATFDSPVRDAAAALPTLVAYSARMMARYYPQ